MNPVVGIHVHGAELEHLERAAGLSDALLPEEHGPFRRELHEGRHEQEHGRECDQKRGAACDIQRSLRGIPGHFFARSAPIAGAIEQHRRDRVAMGGVDLQAYRARVHTPRASGSAAVPAGLWQRRPLVVSAGPRSSSERMRPRTAPCSNHPIRSASSVVCDRASTRCSQRDGGALRLSREMSTRTNASSNRSARLRSRTSASLNSFSLSTWCQSSATRRAPCRRASAAGDREWSEGDCSLENYDPRRCRRVGRRAHADGSSPSAGEPLLQFGESRAPRSAAATLPSCGFRLAPARPPRPDFPDTNPRSQLRAPTRPNP